MSRLLLLVALFMFTGCSFASSMRDTGPVYVGESELPAKFKATEYPLITIDGVKLWYDHSIPGWEPSGGYRTVLFDCPVAWMDVGGDRTLCDRSDFRADDESQYLEFANIDGDIMVLHREGSIQIMEHGVWRDARTGDKLRQSAVDVLIRKGSKDVYRQGDVRQIGTSNLWATLGSDAWCFCDPPPATAAY